MTDYPEYSNDAALGNKGRRIVETIVSDQLGWLFREVAKGDLGIDAFVELLREDDRRSEGRLFAMQIKCGHSYLKERTDDGYVFRGESKHLRYWTEYSLPVVLVICNPDTSVCNWVEITPSTVAELTAGWKVTVPFEQTLDGSSKDRLKLVVQRPLSNDVIPLALYRLLIEKFPSINIAQEIELPRDFRGFEYLAKLNGQLVCITYVYRAHGAFRATDISEIAVRLETCARGCGWDLNHSVPAVFAFLVAHKRDALNLAADVLKTAALHPNLRLYRILCNLSYGVWLTELDESDHDIEYYERPES